MQSGDRATKSTPQSVLIPAAPTSPGTHGESQETPEQTLARLNAASRNPAVSAQCQPQEHPSKVVRLRGYYKAKVDQFRDDCEARLKAATPAAEPMRPTSTPTTPSESPAQRLAQISQRRWQTICAIFWLAIVSLTILVHWCVTQFWPGSTPDDAASAAFGVAVVSVIAFATVGAMRTSRINPDDRTALQRALTSFYQHLGED